MAASPVAGVAEASVRALTKLEQVLPGRLRPKFSMLREAVTTLPGPRAAVDPEILTSLSAAITDRQVVGFRYAKADGESSRRLAEPYGLVDAGHRWYVVAWDLGREDWRTFGADRFGSVPVPRGRFTPRSLPGTDLAGYVHDSIVRSPYRYDVVVRIDAPVQQVAELEDDGDGTVLRAGFDSLEYPLIQLAGMGFAFEIIEPAEFRDRARELGSRLREAGRAERPASS
ncbi:helix-turn-helix transcriptional regulator [Arthrobacter mangrovi]|uniref:helix-turn-helix transcriptional regulator n=1 Tax=Arthrobacter mangrovi TaxID=2966350 RepID=UPI00222E5F8C|nr:WYL domain-containing protein [Arthrobacter mangrovi]